MSSLLPAFRSVLCIATLFAAATGHALPRYAVTEVAAPGFRLDATALNDLGQVAGNATSIATGDRQAFLYTAGQMIDIGAGLTQSSHVVGLNNRGDVVGFLTANSTVSGGFLFSEGTMTVLPPEVTEARDINDARQVVGQRGNHAFVYHDGAFTDLGTLGGSSSWASAINQAGQVTGMSDVRPDVPLTHAFRVSDSAMTDLTPSAYVNAGYGNDINSAGVVVGSVWVDYWRAFVSADGVTVELGTLPGDDSSNGFGINDAGQVVGMSFGGEAGTRGFLAAEGKMYDLNDLLDAGSGSWRIESAGSINNGGTILANARWLGEDRTRSVLLTPIPEPSVSALLALGLLAVGARVHVRRRAGGGAEPGGG